VPGADEFRMDESAAKRLRRQLDSTADNTRMTMAEWTRIMQEFERVGRSTERLAETMDEWQRSWFTGKNLKQIAREMEELKPKVEDATKRAKWVVMTPHKGSWHEGTGWVCDRCGAESMDLDMLKSVPCG
jgi:seryl-tRNA synthetase